MTRKVQLLMVFVILFSSPFLCQYTISSPISITSGDDSYGNKSPRLALNADGEIVVFWIRTGSEAFFISTKTEDGFSTPISIPFGGLNPNLWSGSLGPNMAAAGDNMYATFEVYGDAIYVVYSDDGGANWSDPVAAFTPPDGRRATIPTIAVDSQGQPYVAYVNTNAAEEDAYYAMVKSVDFGMSFLPEVDVSSASFGDEVCECCNGHIDIAENGDIYIAFRNNNDNLRDNWLVRSTDGGSTFVDAFDVDETDWTANVCPSNGPHFSLQGNEIVNTFYSGAGDDGSGVYYSAFDPSSDVVSETISVPKTSDSSINQNRPRIAGDGETFAIVWQEYVNGSTDIGMSISTAGSDGLADDPFIVTAQASTQQLPSILYDGNIFHVVYEDVNSGTVMYQEVSINAVGIEESDLSLISISPNPSNSNVALSLNSNPKSSNVKIYDMFGRVIYNETLLPFSKEIVDVSSWNAGLYLVSVDGSYVEKMVVTR